MSMKKGDLVKFRSQVYGSSPYGIVITDPKRRPSSKLSGKRGPSVHVVWSDKRTPSGNYQTSLLKVFNESR